MSLTLEATFARWLRRRGLRFAGVCCREKKAGGQAEVEHGHLIFHLPADWLKGAKLVGRESRLEGSAELLQVDAILNRLVAQYAGRPLEWSVRLKVPSHRASFSASVAAPQRTSAWLRVGAGRSNKVARGTPLKKYSPIAHG
jgi:hypothetical protein